MTPIRFGLMIRGQFPREADMAARFAELMEQARLADRLGYASITKGSHYAGAPLQDLQQIPFLARLMGEAPHVRLNAGVVLLALHKPLDIAEQLATLDVMSGGRLIFGAALGYRDVEFKAFGTTARERGQRFEECLGAVKRLWMEDAVTLRGSHFELDRASVSIRPVQKPHPPIWIGANAEPAIRRAARLGDCWYINPHNRLDTIERQLEYYRRCLDEYGKPFPDELPIRREVFVSRTREQAVRLSRPYLSRKYQVYREWGQDRAMPEGDNDLGQDFDALLRDRFLLGSADEVVEQILRLHRRTGTNHVIVSLQWPGMPQSLVLETIETLAAEVFPRVRRGL